jgi:hypothetical protein
MPPALADDTACPGATQLRVFDSGHPTLQRDNTENSKQIFPEKELRSHVSVNDLYIPRIGLPILLQENMWTDPGNI